MDLKIEISFETSRKIYLHIILLVIIFARMQIFQE